MHGATNAFTLWGLVADPPTCTEHSLMLTFFCSRWEFFQYSTTPFFKPMRPAHSSTESLLHDSYDKLATNTHQSIPLPIYSTASVLQQRSKQFETYVTRATVEHGHGRVAAIRSHRCTCHLQIISYHPSELEIITIHNIL